MGGGRGGEGEERGGVSGSREPPAWRACGLGLLGLAVVGLLIVKATAIYDALDPSLAPFDAALTAALESALAEGRVPATQRAPDHAGLEYVVVEDDLGVETFADRLRKVPGWDVIVVVCPYSSGRDIDPDEAGLQGWWLRRRIAGMDGWLNDGIFDVAVIRDGRDVGGFYVSGGVDWGSFAVRR